MTAINAPTRPLAEPIASDLPDKPRTLWRDATNRIKRDKVALVALGVLVVYIIVALLGFTKTLSAASEKRFGGTNEPPRLFSKDDAENSHLSPTYWCGTDFLGRSVMWRLLFGMRIAMTVAILASLLETVIGVTLGAVAGFFGGWIDAIIVWLFSTVASVPWILLMISLAYVLQGREIHIPFTEKSFPLAGVPTIVLALGLTSWVGLCRLIRGEVLKHRDRDYVFAARAVGLSNTRIIFRHIFPNVFHLVIINFSLGLAGYVQSEVVLSFLGLGVTDKPSWGRMIDDAKLELLKGVWWQMAAATTAIFVFSWAVNIFGDALRDALDPRLRGVD
jgi:ABC-type dipeptide/oligopeptide/nickel transport system permease subunit